MVDGEIVETGTPQRLLINGGYYTALMEQYNNTMADMAVSGTYALNVHGNTLFRRCVHETVVPKADSVS